MPENVVDLISKIQSVKGQEYVKGLVDMANILAPDHSEDQQDEEDRPLSRAGE